MTKITDIKVTRTRANGSWGIVKVFTDQPGLYGIGSASDYRCQGAVIAAIDELMAPQLIGKDPGRIDLALEKFNELVGE